MKILLNLIVLILCLNAESKTLYREWLPYKGSTKDKKGVRRECYGKIDTFLQQFADKHNQILVITEAMDTINRTNNSFHKIPCGARDVRVWNLTSFSRERLILEAKEAGFFAIDEVNHIHIDIGGMKSKEDRLKILERHK